jgi:hypothetical protein
MFSAPVVKKKGKSDFIVNFSPYDLLFFLQIFTAPTISVRDLIP